MGEDVLGFYAAPGRFTSLAEGESMPGGIEEIVRTDPTDLLVRPIGAGGPPLLAPRAHDARCGTGTDPG